MTLQLIKTPAGEFHAITGGWEDGQIVKAVGGWRWNPAAKHWWTRDPSKAEPLARYADEALAAELTGATAVAREAAQAAVAASRAVEADVAIPVPAGLAYLGYQKAGIAYAAAKPGVLIGDEMGLGKTIQAIGVFNVDPSIRRVLVVCPASLKLNWQREVEKWATRPVTVGLATAQALPATDWVIVNFDILAKLRRQIDAVAWDLLIADEVHNAKNPKAQRTVALFGGVYPPTAEEKAAAKAQRRKPEGVPDVPIAARRRVFLTGTPILNRPVELWPLVEALDPAGLGANFFAFAKRYCNAERGTYGWDFTGASHLDELQNRMRAAFMVRRLKADVLTELPAKRRQIIEIAANGAGAIVAREAAKAAELEQAQHDARGAALLAEAAGDASAYRAALARLRDLTQAHFTELAKLRHDTAVAKIPYVAEHVREAIEAGGKVILFAHHHDVVDAIAAEFGAACVTVTGQTPLPARQAAVDRFQSDPSCVLFIGNIKAAGVGLTLTASSHVVFAELPWTPGEASQAEDRAHRIGQRNSVLVQHLLFEGSIDVKMARTIVAKQEVIDRALDVGAGDAGIPQDSDVDVDALVAEADAIAAERAARAQAGAERAAQVPAWARAKAEQEARVAKADAEASTLTPAQHEAIHLALRIVAGLCDGAFARDGQGFNGADTHIGKQLASLPSLTGRQAVLGRKVVAKYVRQYGPDLKAQMGA